MAPASAVDFAQAGVIFGAMVGLAGALWKLMGYGAERTPRAVRDSIAAAASPHANRAAEGTPSLVRPSADAGAGMRDLASAEPDGRQRTDARKAS